MTINDIKELRKKAGSFKALAGILGCSAILLQKVEAGDRRITRYLELMIDEAKRKGRL